MSQTRGKKMAIWAGLLVAVMLAASVALNHRELLVQFRLLELRSAPERLPAYLEAPEGSALHEALDRDLEGETGRREYFQLLLGRIGDSLSKSRTKDFLSLQEHDEIRGHFEDSRLLLSKRCAELHGGEVVNVSMVGHEDVELPPHLVTPERLAALTGTQMDVPGRSGLVGALLRDTRSNRLQLRICRAGQRLKEPEALMEDLRSGDDTDRHLAREALRSLGRAAVPALLTGLEVQETRFQSALILAEADDPRSRQALPVLAESLREDSDDSRRRQVVQTLGARAPGSPETIPVVTIALEDPSSAVVIEAAKALEKWGRESGSAVPGLIRLVGTSPDWEVRRWAVGTLGAIGQAARSAVPVLERVAASDDYGNVRRVAEEALRAISGR